MFDRIRFGLKALSWLDHLDEAGWYKNKRYFVQLVTLCVYGAALFNLDLQIGEAEKLAVAGGIVALVDIVARAVGRRVDQKRSLPAAEAKESNETNKTGSRNPKL